MSQLPRPTQALEQTGGPRNEPMRRRSVSVTPAELTFNRVDGDASSVKQAAKRPYRAKVSNQVHRQHMEALTQKGFTVPEAFRMLQDGLKKPGASTESIEQLVTDTPAKEPASEIKSAVERPMTRETYVKKSLYPRLKKRLEKQGYEKQEAKDIVKKIINSLGGPAACPVDDVKIIVKMLPAKTAAAASENRTREAALPVLGLDGSASLDEILAAYQRL